MFGSSTPPRRQASAARLGAAISATLIVSAGLTSCGTPPAKVASDSPCVRGASGHPVTVVVGARANSAWPLPLPTQAVTVLDAAAGTGQQITLITVDGSPSVAHQSTFTSDAHNSKAREADLNNYKATINDKIKGLRASTPEADDLTALQQAARDTPAGGTVVMIDSGLQTTGMLDFRSPDLIAAPPADITRFLGNADALPALTGKAVIFLGLGQTVRPQQELSQQSRDQLTTIWKAVANAGQASCVHALPDVLDGKAATGLPTVSQVTPPATPSFQPCGDTVLSDSGSVGFLSNSDKFRDHDAAHKTLAKLADEINRRRLKATLTGTTAKDGDEAGRLERSRSRAEAIKAALVGLGVPAGSLSAKGVGSDFPGYVDDHGPDGGELPGPAEHNRSVIVTLSCPTR